MARDEDDAFPPSDTQFEQWTTQQVFDAFKALPAEQRSDREGKRLFGEFYRRTASRVLAEVTPRRRMLPAYADPEDIVQQVFLKALAKCEDCDRDAVGWIVRIARNLCADAKRKGGREDLEADIVRSDGEGEPSLSPIDEGLVEPSSTALVAGWRTLLKRPDGLPLAREECWWVLNFAQLEYLVAAEKPMPVPLPMLQVKASGTDWSKVTDAWIHEEAWRRCKHRPGDLLPRLRDLVLFRLRYFDGLEYDVILEAIGPFMESCFERLSRLGTAPGKRASSLGRVGRGAARKAISGVKDWLCDYTKKSGLSLTPSGWWVSDAD